MAIIEVNELTKDRPGIWKKEARTYKRYFQVLSDDIADTAYTVLSDENIPVMGSGIEDELVEVVQLEANVEEEDARLVWLVTVSYEVSDDGDKKPWEKDPVVSFSYKSYGIIITKAYDYTNDDELRDTPSLTMENSANFQYNPPPSKEESNTLILITFSLPFEDFEMESAGTFKDTLNKEKLTIAGIQIPALQGRIIKISPTLKKYVETDIIVIQNNGTAITYYWEVIYEVEKNPKGWPLAADDYSYKDSTGKYYKDDSDNATDQYKLDGAGAFLEDQTAAAISKKWDVYWQEDWDTLGFPEEVQTPVGEVV